MHAHRSDDIMWSRLFRLSRDRKISYQRQLREMIVSAILDDKLPLDLPLPSSRELARHLGIARNTVVLAYQQLIDEGYLVSRERSGYFIDKTILDAHAAGLGVHGEHAALAAAVGAGPDLHEVALANAAGHGTGSSGSA